jgi:hypothetical protein
MPRRAKFSQIGVRIICAPISKWGMFMVALVRELRRKAALCRRSANVPTSGSGNADRILMALAEQLEHDAALRERQLQEDVSNFRPGMSPAAP